MNKYCVQRDVSSLRNFLRFTLYAIFIVLLEVKLTKMNKIVRTKYENKYSYETDRIFVQSNIDRKRYYYI